MNKILVTVFFDIEHGKELEDRDYDRFIVEANENNFRERVFSIFEQKRYAWDDFEKIIQGYKAIMGTETSDLTELEIFTDESFTKVENLELETSEEGEWELEV